MKKKLYKLIRLNLQKWFDSSKVYELNFGKAGENHTYAMLIKSRFFIMHNIGLSKTCYWGYHRTKLNTNFLAIMTLYLGLCDLFFVVSVQGEYHIGTSIGLSTLLGLFESPWAYWGNGYVPGSTVVGWSCTREAMHT